MQNCRQWENNSSHVRASLGSSLSIIHRNIPQVDNEVRKGCRPSALPSPSHGYRLHSDSSPYCNSLVWHTDRLVPDTCAYYHFLLGNSSRLRHSQHISLLSTVHLLSVRSLPKASPPHVPQIYSQSCVSTKKHAVKIPISTACNTTMVVHKIQWFLLVRRVKLPPAASASIPCKIFSIWIVRIVLRWSCLTGVEKCNCICLRK